MQTYVIMYKRHGVEPYPIQVVMGNKGSANIRLNQIISQMRAEGKVVDKILNFDIHEVPNVMGYAA
jgi:hypothetical protein